ncbi:MAG: GGDEF domain-containing protein [Acholeplasmatales bacterium]|nr:GGDEF domain-containing protein [Acholeplasmatales bacterium]
MHINISIDQEKVKKLSSFFSCLIFLIAHILYFTAFLALGVKPLIFINIGSILFYILMFILIKYRLYSLYVNLTGIEIALYMFVGALLLGRNCGFHLCLIGLSTLIFFASYFSKQKPKNRIYPMLFGVLYTILIIIVYLYLRYNDPYTRIKDIYETILYITHILITCSFVCIFLYILTTHAVNLEKKIQHDSMTDKLTNVSNRLGLSQYYDKIGDQKNNYLIAIFDIDDFKKFNDKNGHLCGDYVLKQIAKIAQENSSDDFVSRWGGEEFVIISKIDENIEDTYKKIDNIRKSIEEYNFKYNNKSLKSTITIGIALFDNDISLEDWILRADDKLYYGKQNGKNQTVK